MAKNIILQVDKNISAISYDKQNTDHFTFKARVSIGLSEIITQCGVSLFYFPYKHAKCKLGCSLSYNGFNTAYTC
jgi:hypothetical protein